MTFRFAGREISLAHHRQLRDRIQRSVRQVGKTSLRWLTWSWGRVLAPIAAAAVIVLALVPFLRGPSSEEILTREIISNHVRSLMANQLATFTLQTSTQ